MAKPCSKSVFKLNLALYLLFRYDGSAYSSLFNVGVLRPIWPVTMTTTLLQETCIEMSEIH